MAGELKQCREIVAHLRGIRLRREPAWRQLGKWICPWRGLFEEADRLEDDDDTARFTHVAEDALIRGASGMTSGMTPRNISWFKPEFSDAGLAEASGARAWLDAVDAAIRDALAGGGFYQAIYNFNIDLICFGCALLYTEKADPVLFECVRPGTFLFSVNRDQTLDCAARLLSMTAAEMARVFGRDALSAEARRRLDKSPYEPLKIQHLVRENGKGGFSSHYWEETGADSFLRVGTYPEMPFFHAVWTEGATPYGTGPGDSCLADARQLDILERNKLAGMEKLIDPPTQAPYNLKDYVDLTAGAINFVAERQRIEPILDLGPYATALRQIQEEIAIIAKRLENGLKASIFASVSLEQRPPGMTATEFLERKREALSQLGPVISAYEPSMLTPMLFRVARLLDRQGLLPPPPQSLAGMPLFMKMDFISPMATALRQTGAETTRALFQDVAAMLQATQAQEILDKVDLDQMIDEIATGIGTPGKVIRADEDVAAIRQQRQQARQEQEGLAMAMQMAEVQAKAARAPGGRQG